MMNVRVNSPPFYGTARRDPTHFVEIGGNGMPTGFIVCGGQRFKRTPMTRKGMQPVSDRGR